MTIVISVENLGKKYVLNHRQHHGHMNFRDVLTNTAKNFLRPNIKSTQEEFWALKDLSFNLSQGDCLGIVGKNGAGKSTFLKILSKISPPTYGRIMTKGRIASLLEVGTGFHPELSGRENIFLNGSILGMTKREITQKFDEIVAFAEIEKFLDTPVKRYSSGMYVRLAFSIAAHLESEILIVDEVLAVGDLSFQKKCLGKIEQLGVSGRTTIFVSHNMALIGKLCNKALYLKNGQLEAFGKTSEIIRKYVETDTTESSLDKTVIPSMRNRGGTKLQILRCTISNTFNEKKKHFMIGEDLEVIAEFISDYEGFAAGWMIIFDSQGLPVISSHQRDTDGFVEIKKGASIMKLTTQLLGLLPGKYYISLGLFDRDMNFLEWIDSAQDFEIEPTFSNGKPFDGRWGMVNHIAKWEINFEKGSL